MRFQEKDDMFLTGPDNDEESSNQYGLDALDGLVQMNMRQSGYDSRAMYGRHGW